jgi:hypothetical protein
LQLVSVAASPPKLHDVAHAPIKQTCALGHLLLHPPQLFGSDSVTAHMFPHGTPSSQMMVIEPSPGTPLVPPLEETLPLLLPRVPLLDPGGTVESALRTTRPSGCTVTASGGIGRPSA